MNFEQYLTHENKFLRETAKTLISLKIFKFTKASILSDDYVEFEISYLKENIPTSIWIVCRYAAMWRKLEYVIYGDQLSGATFESLEGIIDFLTRYAERIKRNDC